MTDGWGIMRRVSVELNRCLLSFASRRSIDVEKARRQHESYQDLLASMGLDITMIPELPDHPDCCFVEDPAVLIGRKKAVICRTGTPERRGEELEIANSLERRGLELVRMNGTARADGGDVLRMGNTYYVGLSTRTNREGFEVIAGAAEAEGFAAHPVQVRGALHLKTIVTRVGVDSVVGLKEHLGEGLDLLERFDWIVPPRGEEAAANVVAIGNTVIVPSIGEGTARMIEKRGLKVLSIDIGELQKAEAGLTCMAILSA